MTATLTDTARFRAGDHPDVVEASFCCQLCLRRASLIVVGVADQDARAWCYCTACREHTEVVLNADQVLRLRLAPPRTARIHLIEEAADAA